MTSKLASLQRNSWLGWVARLTLTIVLLLFLLSRIDLANIIATLTQAKRTPLAISLALAFVIRYIWAYQVSFGLKPLALSFDVFDLFKINLVSTFYGLLLPGDLVAGGASWYKLSRPSGKGVEAAVLLVYFRLVNTLTLLGVGVAGIWFDPRFVSIYFRAVLVLVVIALIILLLMFFSPSMTRFFESVVGHILRRLSPSTWIRDKEKVFWQAIAAFQTMDRRTIIVLFGLSFLSHLLGVFNHYFLTLAVDIHLPAFVVGWIRSLVVIIQMLPVSIAGLGVREVSVVLLLKEYGVSSTQAMSFSILFFSLTVVAGMVGGLFEGYDFLFSWRRTSTDSQVG